MMQIPNCSFILSVEYGKLESQAILLVESLRRFGGNYANCPVYAVSPRSSRQMGADCVAALTALGAITLTLDLIPANEAYGSTGRVAACAWAEQNIASEILVGLDNDLLFIQEPNFRLTGGDFFARPVDAKGICTSGASDPYDPYWRQIAAMNNVDYEQIPWLHTTMDNVYIKACYNGGMLAVRREKGLFQRTAAILQDFRNSNLIPYPFKEQEIFASTGFVGTESTNWWGTSQSAFSLAVMQTKAISLIAGTNYNIPIHVKQYLRKQGVKNLLQNAVLVHYHWLLSQEYIHENPLFYPDSGLPEEFVTWLKSRPPFA